MIGQSDSESRRIVNRISVLSGLYDKFVSTESSYREYEKRTFWEFISEWTGLGRESIKFALHDLSRLKYIVINCADGEEATVKFRVEPAGVEYLRTNLKVARKPWH